jgi:hypothetical protein
VVTRLASAASLLLLLVLGCDGRVTLLLLPLQGLGSDKALQAACICLSGGHLTLQPAQRSCQAASERVAGMRSL